jgi:hypothetical protein
MTYLALFVTLMMLLVAVILSVQKRQVRLSPRRPGDVGSPRSRNGRELSGSPRRRVSRIHVRSGSLGSPGDPRFSVTAASNESMRVSPPRSGRPARLRKVA